MSILPIIILDTIFDFRNGANTGDLLSSDLDKFRKYVSSVSGTIGSTYKNGPLTVIIKYKLFWGDSAYPMTGTINSVYWGSKKIWIDCSQSGGQEQALWLNFDTFRWSLYTVKFA